MWPHSKIIKVLNWLSLLRVMTIRKTFVALRQQKMKIRAYFGAKEQTEHNEESPASEVRRSDICVGNDAHINFDLCAQCQEMS